jgi:hypothetical protein
LVFAGYTTGTPSVDVWIRHSNGVPITGELATELSQAQQKYLPPQQSLLLLKLSDAQKIGLFICYNSPT